MSRAGGGGASPREGYARVGLSSCSGNLLAAGIVLVLYFVGKLCEGVRVCFVCRVVVEGETAEEWGGRIVTVKRSFLQFQKLLDSYQENGTNTMYPLTIELITLSCSHNPNTLTPSHPHTLELSHPHTLTPIHPHTLAY